MSAYLEALARENPDSVYTRPDPTEPEGVPKRYQTRTEKAIEAPSKAPTRNPDAALFDGHLMLPTTPTTRNKTMNPNPTPNRDAGKAPETLSELFPRAWLVASDLKRPVTVTIADAETVQVHDLHTQKKVWRVALGFTYTDAQGEIHELSKRLLCNRTQGRVLADMCGSERFSDWQGLRVLLFPTQAHNGKATVGVAPAQDKS